MIALLILVAFLAGLAAGAVAAVANGPKIDRALDAIDTDDEHWASVAEMLHGEQPFTGRTLRAVPPLRATR